MKWQVRVKNKPYQSETNKAANGSSCMRNGNDIKTSKINRRKLIHSHIIIILVAFCLMTTLVVEIRRSHVGNTVDGPR